MPFDSQRNRLRGAWTACVSFFVLVILIGQSYAIPAQILGSPIAGYYWPFMDYPMYANVRRDGDYITYEYRVECELENGSWVRAEPADFGLSFWHFYRRVRHVAAGHRSTAKDLASLYSGGEVVSVRVYTPPLIVTRDGYADAPPKLLAELRLRPAPKESLRARP